MQQSLSLDEQLVIKFRALDDVRLTMEPDDALTLKLVTESWLAMIKGYESLDPKMARFAREQFAELLADHNKASIVIKNVRMAIDRTQEREVCKLIAELLPPKNSEPATLQEAESYIEERRAKQAVG